MTNPELSRTVDSQITDIFKSSFPSESRFRDCDKLIQDAKAAFLKIPELRIIESADGTSKFSLGFTIINNKLNASYQITYKRNYSINSEEKLTIVRNKLEKIKLHTYKYGDGRFNAFVEYFDDYPDFNHLKSTDFDENKTKAEKIIGELINFL